MLDHDHAWSDKEIVWVVAYLLLAAIHACARCQVKYFALLSTRSIDIPVVKIKTKWKTMSESTTPGAPDARAASPTPSERSIKSDVSTASSRLPKPTGMRPPQATISSGASASSSAAAAAAAPATPSSSRIGRLCTAHGHGAKAGPPPLELNKSECCFYRSMAQNYLDYKIKPMKKSTSFAEKRNTIKYILYDRKCPVNTRCMEETHAQAHGRMTAWNTNLMHSPIEVVNFLFFAWLL